MASDDLQREMERYLAHFLNSRKRPTMVSTQHSHATQSWTPSIDMYETDDAVVVLLDLAGVDASQTEVQAEPHVLIVRGVRRERHVTGTQRSYHALEIPYGRFERVLRLPTGTDTSAAQAAYRDGLLEITVPKTRPMQVPIARPDDAGAARERLGDDGTGQAGRSEAASVE
jgi:HSP20 family protein